MRQPQLTLTLLLLLSLLPATLCQALDESAIFCGKLELPGNGYASENANITAMHDYLTRKVAGCQVVDGDLVIRDIGMSTFYRPLSWAGKVSSDFLNSIVEIRGRLQVLRVVARLSLRNLRVIRGHNPERYDRNYAIDVSSAEPPFQLRLPKLAAIGGGGVNIGHMPIDFYCRYSRLIEWPRLFQDPGQRFNASVSHVILLNGSRIRMPNYQILSGMCKQFDCHSGCGGHCWDNGEENCQFDNSCPSGSCSSAVCGRRRDGRAFCCHNNCIGGCTGTGDNECVACRDVNNNGRCVSVCPRGDKMDPETGKLIMGEHKMQAGGVCVKSCPSKFVADSSGSYCLSECPGNQIPINETCTKCTAGDSTECAVCEGLPRFVDAKLVQMINGKNCTIWKLSQNQVTVQGPTLESEVLKSIRLLRVLFGRLIVKDFYLKNVTNLSFLKDLQTTTKEIYIMHSKLRYLGLSGLNTPEKLIIHNVSGLCQAWFPYNAVNISGRKVYFDNSSVECTTASCDSQCSDSCWGPGPNMCVTCRNVTVNGTCFASCESLGMYGDKGSEGLNCIPCDSRCIGCSGPGPARCWRCRNAKQFGVCVDACSDGLELDAGGMCRTVLPKSVKIGIIAGFSTLLFLLLLLLFSCRYYSRRLRKYDFIDLDEYLGEANSSADMTKLMLVNDEDITKLKEIGSGAFGTVYKGKLRCNTIYGVRQLPVAVKVLHGRSPKHDQELLAEASVLARVKHQHCIRLVALCLTKEVQLITALMPRGCLLSFLRARVDRVGAERMLTWAMQVAQGMRHLQSLGILHRDLAARNVLLESLDCVRITDFGLARLADSGFDETDRLPLRWLSVENFNGEFSHKSDVWSYGVLLWEICTYGEIPYTVHTIAGCDDLRRLLESGIRLSQPDICSVDFYNYMLICWLPDPDSRPTFEMLEQIMANCLLTPAKYIAKCPTTDSDEQQQQQQQQFAMHHINVYSDDPTVRQNKYVKDPTYHPDEEYLVPRSEDDCQDYLQPRKE